MNKLLSSVILVVSFGANAGSANAGDINSNDAHIKNASASHGCNIKLDNQVSISHHSIVVLGHDRVRYEIKNNKTLFVDGKAVELNSAQQQLVSDYAQQVRAILPVAQSLALDGVDMAIVGVQSAFDELLGENNTATTELLAVLQDSKQEVNRYFDLEQQPMLINGNENVADKFFGEAFEQRMEAAVESSLEQIASTVFMSLGKEIILGGGIDVFQQRMNNFGRHIETAMKDKGGQLEARGKKLCQSVLALDSLEGAMRNSIVALAGFDVLQVP